LCLTLTQTIDMSNKIDFVMCNRLIKLAQVHTYTTSDASVA